MMEGARAAIVEESTRRDIAEREAQIKAVAASKARDVHERDQLQAEAAHAAVLADSITVPSEPRLVADDATPEVIGSLLVAQRGRLAVMSPEGDVFEIMAGRYTQQNPNVTMFLKAHAGDMLKVDRKSRPAEHVDRPALTIATTVQPSVLESLTRAPGFRGRGLLARFLWSVPHSNMGSRRVNAPAVTKEIRVAYDEHLRALVHTLAGYTDPAVLLLEPDAHELMIHLETELEPRLSPSGDLAHIADWAGKYAGAVARIAGLLHVAEHDRSGWEQPVSRSTMEAASDIGQYFLCHALAAFDVMGADPLRVAAEKVSKWLRGQKDDVSRRDVYRGFQQLFGRAEDVDPVLELLEDLRWIRRLPDPPPKPAGGHPPSPRFAIHPQVRA